MQRLRMILFSVIIIPVIFLSCHRNCVKIVINRSSVQELTIPNREIREVYVLQIKEWFDRAVLKEAEPTKNLLKAINEGNAGEIEERLTKILGNTISIFDTKGRNEEKKFFIMDFCWGFCVVIQTGLFSLMRNLEMVLQIFWQNRKIRMPGSLSS